MAPKKGTAKRGCLSDNTFVRNLLRNLYELCSAIVNISSIGFAECSYLFFSEAVAASK